MLKNFSRKSFLLFTSVVALAAASTHIPLLNVVGYDDDHIPRSITFLSVNQEELVPETYRPEARVGYGNDKSMLRTLEGVRWKAGLSAFFKGDMRLASQEFAAILNDNKDLPSSDRAAVAFWAYRARNALGDRTEASSYLDIAANENPGFYSIIARHIRGWETIPHDLREEASHKDAASKYPMPNWTPASGYRIDQALLFAIMRQESEFDPRALSSRGAIGVMQLMPETAHAMARTIQVSGSIAEPSVSMALGQQYIERLMGTSSIRNNLVFLLAAYNAGPAMVDKWQNSLAYDNDPLLFIESIPYGATRDYVVNVIGNYWVYSELFGSNNPSLTMISQGGWPLYAAGAEKPVAVARD